MNPAKGKAFQVLAAEVMGKHLGVDFDLEGPFLIGNPPKAHKFDLVSHDRRIVGEAKCITWTVGGNSLAAKLAFVTVAVFYVMLAGEPQT